MYSARNLPFVEAAASARESFRSVSCNTEPIVGRDGRRDTRDECATHHTGNG
jgi:hypothetical protein